MEANVTDPCRYLDAIRALALDAGRRILDVYEQGERDVKVTAKTDGSPLTAADRVAHETIAASLKRLTPDIPLLSEEFVAADYETRAHWTRFWLVDPLDGTKEFVSRNGEFTVNIALIENGRPTLGVVYVPVPGLTYYACRGQGAHKHKEGATPRAIRVRPKPTGKPMVVASRSHAGDHLATFLAYLGPHDTVSIGSSLKLCLIAEGTADVYPRLGPTMEWDTAAAQCVVEEAGGQVVDCAGNVLRYNKPDLHNPWFVVSGPNTHDWLALVPPAPAT